MRDRATATLTTIVVDDEKLACDELSYLLRDFPEIEVVACGANGLEAVDLVQKLEPDLVFLDVQMPGPGRSGRGAPAARTGNRATLLSSS